MTKPITVADYLDKMIELSEKTQKEIAHEVGYSKPNMITMMKQGLTKVPIDKAPSLAKALNVDPAHFVRLVMREYMPDAWRAIESTCGQSLSANEQRLIEVYRETCGNVETPVDDKIAAALHSALSGS